MVIGAFSKQARQEVFTQNSGQASPHPAPRGTGLTTGKLNTVRSESGAAGGREDRQAASSDRHSDLSAWILVNAEVRVGFGKRGGPSRAKPSLVRDNDDSTSGCGEIREFRGTSSIQSSYREFEDNGLREFQSGGWSPLDLVVPLKTLTEAAQHQGLEFNEIFNTEKENNNARVQH